jgi:uncharacterized repeat protein (TIGR02543 family)
MKKRMLSVLLALIMVVGLLPAAVLAADTEGEALPFTDVPEDAWYIDAVRYVYENGLMIGTGETTFSPDTTITRAMIVTILHRLEGEPKAKGMDFSDVPEGKWYTAGVAWASANEIVNGFPDGTFLPNDPITREQLVTILYRYAQFKKMDVSVGENTNILSYYDVFDVGDWAMPAMQWACGTGILPGTEGGYLSPAVPATRAETAVVFTRLLNLPEEPQEEEPAEEEETKETVTVKFDRNDGKNKDPEVKEVRRGEKVKAPKEPTRTGYEFKAWYTEAKGGKRFDFSKPVTEDITLYAHWTKKDRAGGEHGGGSDNPDKPAKEDDTLAKVERQMDPYNVDPDTMPIYFDVENLEDPMIFKNDKGETILVTEGSEIELTIQPAKESGSEEEVTGGDEEKEEAVADALAEAAGNISISFEDVAGEINYTAVDADLTLITTVTDEETGKETTTEETIHPIGKTTVTLTRGNLGLPDDADLTQYVFFASHTNANGEEELVPGEVVEIDGLQKVRFVLNGLSRIVIGNVPPLTVTFNTDGGTPVPEPQKVKLGGFVQYVEPPYKEGYLFIGWDFDIRETNIIRDTTITALYVTGEVVTEDQLEVNWLKNGDVAEKPENVKSSFSNGTMTVTLPAASLEANLGIGIGVYAPKDAAQYVTATTAEGAANSTSYIDLATGGIPAVVTAYTDASGKVRLSSTTMYIKWADADGNILGLQSVRLVIRTEGEAVGDYDTQTSNLEVAVNRGVGTYEFYLTNGKAFDGAALPDYVAYINGYLNDRTRNGETEYYLYLYASFQQQFSQGRDAETGEYKYTTYADYTDLRVEITPFEGESFSVAPTVSAYYWDDETGDQVNVSFTSKLSGGKAILTAARPEGDDLYIYLTVTEGDVTQNLNIEFWGRTSRNNTSAYVDTWAEALEELAKGTEYVYYRGSEDVLLTDKLTIEPEQYLGIQQANFTVGNGGVLSVNGSNNGGGRVQLSKMDGVFTVANGGVLTTNSQTQNGSHYYTYVGASRGKLVVKNGGKVTVPDNGLLELQSSSGEIILEAGSTVTSGEGSNFELYTNDGTITIAGTMDTAASLYLYGTTTVEETAKITNSGYFRTNGRFMNYGTITNTGYTINFNGRTENYGTINLNGGRNVHFSHTGYTVTNEGTINIASGVQVVLRGTVLLNTGKILGEGTLKVENTATTSEYDNGIEYADRDENKAYGPDNYDRYKFVRDPAETVNEVTFFGELDDQGTCTVNVEAPKVSMLSDDCPVGETRTVKYSASELTSGTSTIHSFKAEKLDSQTIRFTMEYTVPAGLNYSIFNPPNGDRFMQINSDGTSGEKSTMVFDLSIADLAAVSEVSIKFFNADDSNRCFISFWVNEL